MTIAPQPWLRVAATGLAGVMTIDRQYRRDNRGAFSRFFCADELAAAGIAMTVAQINHSQTQRAGSVRGLHFNARRTPKPRSSTACGAKYSTSPWICDAIRPPFCTGTGR